MNIDKLLEEFELSPAVTLKNRIIMAPLTRCFADEDLAPTELIADYYARRADTGLIISEATIPRFPARLRKVHRFPLPPSHSRLPVCPLLLPLGRGCFLLRSLCSALRLLRPADATRRPLTLKP